MKSVVHKTERQVLLVNGIMAIALVVLAAIILILVLNGGGQTGLKDQHEAKIGGGCGRGSTCKYQSKSHLDCSTFEGSKDTYHMPPILAVEPTVHVELGRRFLALGRRDHPSG